MRVIVLGIRGIPNVQGGVETHAEHLYERLTALGCQVQVLVRTPFVPPERRSFGDVQLRRIWSPTRNGLEAFVHSVLGVFYAAFVRPDVLHIHAVGPAIVTPIARALGLKVVVTHHGPDYDRDKWGRFARWVLRTGERWGMNHSHARIAISKVIATLIMQKYGRQSALIPNGVTLLEQAKDTDHLARFQLQPGRYFLQVSRFVPEKRQLDLIEAYRRSRHLGWKLALVGGLTQDPYSEQVQAAAKHADVVLTGFLRGEALRQLYSHAGAFILPSSHEGLPIAMLEALSYGLPVLASDIPANLELGLEATSYFPLGDVAALAQGLERLSNAPSGDQARAARRAWVARQYDWDRIARRTLEVYTKVAGSSAARWAQN